jgi:signal transduction histidine kinase
VVDVRERLFDAGVVAGVGGLLYLERDLAPPVVLAFGVTMALALLWRRRHPVPVAAVVYGLAAGHLAVRDTVRMFDVAVLVALYAVVKYAPHPRWGVLAGAGAAVGVLIAAWTEQLHTGNFWTVAFAVGAVTTATWFSAYGVRTRRLYIASLEERAATLQRERDHLSRLAAADERAAIARELHDVVAHSLSVMIVQADGASYTLDPAAAEARRALATIADTGREALLDMRRVVAVLRGSAPETPDEERLSEERRRPGLSELGPLIERAGAAGLSVTVEPLGEPLRLSPAMDLTAFRIVQESLTNALRHAGPSASAAVRLDWTGPDGLTITVSDDGGTAPAAAPDPAAGHGLVGMRERAAAHGGSLTAGPLPGGGWRVTATLPRVPEPAS